MPTETKLNSAHFLYAFRRIEQSVKRVAERYDVDHFSTLLDSAAKKNRVIRNFKADIKEYAKLRNAIVHDGRGERVIAEPNEFAVSEIERLANIIEHPPTVFDSFRGEVVAIASTKPIADALKLMKAKGYFQLPVSNGNRVIGLLTSDTVARWLGANVAVGLVDLSDTTVADVLQHAETQDNYCILRREATLVDVLDHFERYAKRGNRLDAILITHQGKASEGFLGIVTAFDLHEVYDKLRVKQ